MNQNYKNIDEYIAAFPKDIQKKLTKIRETIKNAAPEATEAIAYGMPTFKLNGNLVHFAAFKNHLGFFPTPSGIEVFDKETKPYRTGRGTLRFPLDEPIPFDLVKKIVARRVEENRGKNK